jgi:phthiodiolone/phenolphthiodiolone dimycocerosates ketoreductase
MSVPRVAVALNALPVPTARVMRNNLAFVRWAGLDGLVVMDHFQQFVPTTLWDADWTWLAEQVPSPHQLFDPQTLLGWLAAHAGRARLGVVVTEPLRRHPVLIAQWMATLAHLADRPPILGFGSGEAVNTIPFGLDVARPVERFEEALQIVRMCFRPDRPLEFEGKHFRLQGARMDLRPPQDRVPSIWVAAHGPRMLALTGRYGDGWYPSPLVTTPQDYAEKLAVVRASATQAGRDPDAIVPSLERYAFVAPSRDQAHAMARSRAGRFGALMFPGEVWRRFGREHPLGLERGFVDVLLEDYDRETLDAALDAVPEEMMSIACWGTPDDIVEHLEEYATVGMRHVSLMFMSAGVSKRDALYSYRAARHIAQALR